MITDSLTNEALQPSLFDQPTTARVEAARLVDAAPAESKAPEGYVWAVRDSGDARIRYHHLVLAEAVGGNRISTQPACKRGKAGGWVADARVSTTEPCRFCSRLRLKKMEGGKRRWSWPTWVDEDLPCRQPGQDPEMFHSDDPAERARAKAGCAECPFTQECLRLRVALRATTGIWGGKEFGRPKSLTDPDSTCWGGHPWVEETTGVRAGRKYCMVCSGEASVVAEERVA